MSAFKVSHDSFLTYNYIFTFLLICAILIQPTITSQQPYDIHESLKQASGAGISESEFSNESRDLYIGWLRQIVHAGSSGTLKDIFMNGTSPGGLNIEALRKVMDIPYSPIGNVTQSADPNIILKNLGFPLDPSCINDRAKWWYRTYDGSCNWLKDKESHIGSVGTAKTRDFHQVSFADGISAPREGPNPRAVSNAFFKRKKKLYYEHTPLLIGLIEFVMHDVSYSQDSAESIEVPMPPDEDEYHLNTTFRIRRTSPDPSTGTSKDNPRQLLNHATTWLDLSSLYGSNKEVADSLRTFRGGKLLTQKGASLDQLSDYLPFNSMQVPTNSRPGLKSEQLFAGGDPRTNEDWLLLAVHTLFLREHNRLCDILAKRQPKYDDEQLYQTVRVLLAGKYHLLANYYMMSYWSDEMPEPRNDGFPLYRHMYGKNALEINAINRYPWPLVTKDGKPMVISAEMSIVYRFHEFIISSFPIKNEKNETMWEQNLFNTSFNARGFLDAGLEPILRGLLATTIPNFKSGVDKAFRSAGSLNSTQPYRGAPFDIVTWSVVHEREQGLPTFNQYFTAYNGQNPKVIVPIRKRFEDFTSDPEAVLHLKKLYSTPDDVDLVVGVQLDEEMFPGTTVPKSALIISLFSLFGTGNSDRFSVGFAVMRCFIVDTPWDCHPTNALEDLIWAPAPTPEFPNFRWFDQFWVAELDFQTHGSTLLWRLVTENTKIQCIQRNPLFPADPKTNPVLCQLPEENLFANTQHVMFSFFQIALQLARQSLDTVNMTWKWPWRT